MTASSRSSFFSEVGLNLIGFGFEDELFTSGRTLWNRTDQSKPNDGSDAVSSDEDKSSSLNAEFPVRTTDDSTSNSTSNSTSLSLFFSPECGWFRTGVLEDRTELDIRSNEDHHGQQGDLQDVTVALVVYQRRP